MKSPKDYFSDNSFLMSFFSGLLLLGVSFVVQFLSTDYVTSIQSTPVTDIILSNTRVYNVDGIFVYGTVILFFIGIFLAIIHIHKVPFTMKSIALFILIRSVFVILTHIGPFPTQVS